MELLSVKCKSPLQLPRRGRVRSRSCGFKATELLVQSTEARSRFKATELRVMSILAMIFVAKGYG